MSSIGILPYLHVRKAESPSYRPNGERLSFITDITGLPQVWEVPTNGGWAVQASFTEERIMLLQNLPGSSDRIIGMDQGTNERQQLFLLHEDGSLTPLTDSDDHIHHYGGASADGKWIAWGSNRRHPAFFDIYVQNLETKEIKHVYSLDETQYPLKWHPNGKQLLISKTKSLLDHDYGLLNLESGEVRWITPHEEEASYENGQFSQDGTKLYLLTSAGREMVGFASLDLETLQLTWLDEREWDLEGLTKNNDGSVFTYTSNEGGVSSGALYYVEENKIVNWQAPGMGVISDLSFSPCGRKVAYIFNGPASPAEVWELQLETLESTKLTNISSSPILEGKLVEPELIEFASFDGLVVPAFYYKPKQATEGEKLPVVVYVHGGPESQIRATYNPFLQYFLERGFAVCTPNVRGSTGYGKTYSHLDDVRKRMDSVADLASLVEWLVTEGGADRSKVAIMGRSYGGFMVLAAITHYPTIWSAAIDIVGISSFKTFLQKTSVWRRKLREVEYGSIEADGEFFEEIDPIHRVSQITAPLLVLHGQNDPRVPVEEAEQIVAELEARNHPVSYICFEDEGHFFVKLKNNITAYTAVADFFDRYIG